MNYGECLLSAVVDRNDVAALRRFNVKESDFVTPEERKAYRFITDYAEQNRGHAPDYRTVVAECDGFNYRPNVEDSLEFMVKQIKNYRAKVSAMDFLQKEAPEAFRDKDGLEFLTWMADKLSEIKQQYEYREKIGIDVALDYNRGLSEYERRKQGKSFKVWKSKFPTINEEIGGYLSGNMYTWYGRSGRGKSIFTLEEAIESAMQGATVLIWALEMAEFEVLTRAYTSISGRLGLVNTKIDGIDYEAGFPARDILMGKLSEEWEAGFVTFLQNLNQHIPGKIIVRAVDHQDFYHRGVKQLESDILATKADVVIVDPIYYMDFERNTSQTKGGDVAATSKRLRHIAGYTKAVLHVITQAEEVKDDTDEEGNRELRAPKRAEIKKTKAVLEDATNTFGIDTVDGRGIIEIGKGRNGGEGVQVEVIYLPNYGLVREIAPEEVADNFDYGF
jgi:DnaB-like helicase C terminal domain